MDALGRRLQAALGLLLCAVLVPCMPAEPAAQASAKQVSAKQASAKQGEAEAKSAALPLYKPPLRGAPGGRVGGGTRGMPGRDIFVLAVLAPDHTGLTTTEQPSLFWFISAATSLPVELTISDPNKVEPVLEARVPPAVERGVHRLRLADFGVRLAPGVTYQWSVTVVPDPARRSRDILASGMIQRVEPSVELASRQAAAPDLDAVRLYAENGLWYDALDAVSQLMESAPGDQMARRYRAALLQQVGLGELSEQ